MRKLLTVLFLGLCLALPGVARGDDAAPTMVINLTDDDAWSAGMALGLATRLQKGGGGAVVAFFNVRAVRLANLAAPAEPEPGGATVHQMVADFMQAGGRVFVCAMCTRRAGLDIADRLPGTEVGGDELVAILMAPGTRIMSY